MLATEAHSTPDISSEKAEYRNQFTHSNSNSFSDDSISIESIDKSTATIIVRKDQPTLNQNTKTGFLFALIFGFTTGINYVTVRMAVEKYDLKIHQMVLPESLILIFCAFIFGTINGVSFQDPYDKRRIYSFYSYSWPGNPWIHQMIIHRSMMSIFSWALLVYSVATLPLNICAPILMLKPFMIAFISSLSLPEECVSLS